MAKAIPAYTYSGSSSTAADNTYWYIFFKTGGTLRMTYTKSNVSAFLVGGGGGGGNGASSAGNTTSGLGGLGGAIRTATVSLTGGSNYTITIGGGGARATNGSATSAFGQSAAGGTRGGTCPNPSTGYTIPQYDRDGRFRVGATGTRPWSTYGSTYYGAGGGHGGSRNSGGGGISASAGGTTGGGAGGAGAGAGSRGRDGGNATANTGSGGGGGGGGIRWSANERFNAAGGVGGAGGSGIVIIRGTQDDPPAAPTVTYPVNAKITHNSKPYIKVTQSSTATSVSYKVNSGSWHTVTSGSLTRIADALVSGSNTIYFKCTSSAGDSTEVSRTVTYTPISKRSGSLTPSSFTTLVGYANNWAGYYGKSVSVTAPTAGNTATASTSMDDLIAKINSNISSIGFATSNQISSTANINKLIEDIVYNVLQAL